MSLPFTEQQFLDVFSAYNNALWPAVLIWWGLAVAALLAITRGTEHAPLTLLFVAGLWAWSGVAYHAVFFSEINPAAWIFAGMFVFEAVCLTWLATKEPSIRFELGSTLRGWAAAVFLVYAVAYPVLVSLSGTEFPGAPAFAVPCPTVLFTTGVLLALRPGLPRWLYAVPVLWSIIAGSAAILFGITPDFMLFAAAIAMVLDAVTSIRPARTPRLA